MSIFPSSALCLHSTDHHYNYKSDSKKTLVWRKRPKRQKKEITFSIVLERHKIECKHRNEVPFNEAFLKFLLRQKASFVWKVCHFNILQNNGNQITDSKGIGLFKNVKRFHMENMRNKLPFIFLVFCFIVLKSTLLRRMIIMHRQCLIST